MEMIELTHIAITNEDGAATDLTFRSAQLVIVTDHGSKLWYIDTTDTGPASLLGHYYASTSIGVEVAARTEDGRQFQGSAYVHANIPKQALVLRGDGELTESRE